MCTHSLRITKIHFYVKHKQALAQQVCQNIIEKTPNKITLYQINTQQNKHTHKNNHVYTHAWYTVGITKTTSLKHKNINKHTQDKTQVKTYIKIN